MPATAPLERSEAAEGPEPGRRGDAVLLRTPADATDAARLLERLWQAAEDLGLAPAAAEADRGIDAPERYLYLWLARPAPPVEATLRRLGAALGAAEPPHAAWLEGLQDLAGASQADAARFHYTVETDVAPGHDADLNAWYGTEHLPGLAAVPGTVRARRLRNLGPGPRYHACYDLVSIETMGSPAWLAVRHTAWSDRVRPQFRNTRRVMFTREAMRTAPAS